MTVDQLYDRAFAYLELNPEIAPDELYYEMIK